MPTLYQLSAEMLELDALAAALQESDLSDEERAALQDDLNARAQTVFSELGPKLDNYGCLVKEKEARARVKEAHAKTLRDEADRIAQSAKAEQNGADELKARLLDFMRTHGTGPLKTERFTFRAQANGGKAPLVLQCEPEELPARFQKIIVAADNEGLRQALLDGEAEAHEVASLKTGGQHLRIV